MGFVEAAQDKKWGSVTGEEIKAIKENEKTKDWWWIFFLGSGGVLDKIISISL